MTTLIETLKVVRDHIQPQMQGLVATPKDLDSLHAFIANSGSPRDCTIVAITAYNLAVQQVQNTITEIIDSLPDIA
jgi:Lhr-like helicase